MQELVVTILLGLLALGGLGMLLWGRSPKSNMTKRQKKTLLRIVEATALLLLLQLLPPSLFEALGPAGFWVRLGLYLLVDLLLGYDILL